LADLLFGTNQTKVYYDTNNAVLALLISAIKPSTWSAFNDTPRFVGIILDCSTAQIQSRTSMRRLPSYSIGSTRTSAVFFFCTICINYPFLKNW